LDSIEIKKKSMNLIEIFERKRVSRNILAFLK